MFYKLKIPLCLCLPVSFSISTSRLIVKSWFLLILSFSYNCPLMKFIPTDIQKQTFYVPKFQKVEAAFNIEVVFGALKVGKKCPFCRTCFLGTISSQNQAGIFLERDSNCEMQSLPPCLHLHTI